MRVTFDNHLTVDALSFKHICTVTYTFIALMIEFTDTISRNDTKIIKRSYLSIYLLKINVCDIHGKQCGNLNTCFAPEINNLFRAKFFNA